MKESTGKDPLLWQQVAHFAGNATSLVMIFIVKIRSTKFVFLWEK